jgi:hypothetical protein
VRGRDGAWLFSSGGVDRTVNMWAVNVAVLDAAEALGGGGVAPYLKLLDGGANGPLHQVGPPWRAPAGTVAMR